MNLVIWRGIATIKNIVLYRFCVARANVITDRKSLGRVQIYQTVLADVEEREPIRENAIMDRPWQVLRVRSNLEKRVAQHLTVRSIEHYLPLYQERAKWTDRIVIAERPLFPGYVFARYLAQSKTAVISTPGVVRALGDKPGDLVSGAELNRIREGLRSGLPLRPHPHIREGTRVQIRTGIFAGTEGIVSELRQQCKVVIAVAAARQCFSLEVESRYLDILDKLTIFATKADSETAVTSRIKLRN